MNPSLPPPSVRKILARSIMTFALLSTLLYTLLILFTLLTLRILDFFNLINLLLLMNNWPCQWLMRFINKFCDFTDYFQQFNLIQEQQDNDQDPRLYSVHPHSVLAMGALLNSSKSRPLTKNRKLSEALILSSRAMLLIPITGFILRSMGLQGVNPQNFNKNLAQKKNIIFLPGGFQEATLTTPHKMRFYVQNRKGFIKYALIHGYKLVQMVCMGEHKSHSTFDYFKSFRLFLNKLKLPAVIAYGQWGTILPRWSVRVALVLGKTIKLPKIDRPSEKDIQYWHSVYQKQLCNLYERHKHLNDNSE